jgi:spermidine synthase
MLREILKHRSVEKAVLVEIDGGVVEFCKSHMPSVSDGAFDDPRTEVIITDGIKFMAETDRKFDLIVVDSTDPIGPGEVLFSESFYKDCARCLTEDGIVVNQNGVPFLQGQEVTDTYRRRKPHFADVGFFVAAVPTYVGGFMALGWAAKSKRPGAETVETIQARFDAAPVQTRYYTPDLHKASFALPKFVRDLVKD